MPIKERRSACEIGIVVNHVLTDLNIVDEWLRENHESPRAGKVFVMFINEGMTSVQQVANIAICINFILKKAIKGRYQAFRDSAVEGLTISELAGSVITVPREDFLRWWRPPSMTSIPRIGVAGGSPPHSHSVVRIPGRPT